MVSGWHFLLGGAGLAAFAAMVEGAPRITWTPRFVAILAVLALLGTAWAFVVWFREAQRCEPSVLSAWTFLTPVFGISFAVVLLGERPSGWTAAGLGLVLVSLWRTPPALAAACAGVWGLWRALSPSVRRWRPGAGESRRAGPLRVRTFGDAAHRWWCCCTGMAAAGNSFGAAYDRLGESARVVVPDLLGFGALMMTTGPVTGEDHLAALDATLAALGLAGEPLVVVGHSMGVPSVAVRRPAPRTGVRGDHALRRAIPERCRGRPAGRADGPGRGATGRGRPAPASAVRVDVPSPKRRRLGGGGRPPGPARPGRPRRGQTHLGQLPRRPQRLAANPRMGARAAPTRRSRGVDHPSRGWPRPGTGALPGRRARLRGADRAAPDPPARHAPDAAQRGRLVRNPDHTHFHDGGPAR